MSPTILLLILGVTSVFSLQCKTVKELYQSTGCCHDPLSDLESEDCKGNIQFTDYDYVTSNQDIDATTMWVDSKKTIEERMTSDIEAILSPVDSYCGYVWKSNVVKANGHVSQLLSDNGFFLPPNTWTNWYNDTLHFLKGVNNCDSLSTLFPHLDPYLEKYESPLDEVAEFISPDTFTIHHNP